jgi:O-succinylbenzoic acid--CoA ligase
MKPVLGTEVRIVADEREARLGEPGEILVRGPTVMSGYLNASDATARALRDGWLRTGDIGYRDAEGGLHVLDRRDDLVVSGGENVYPVEVEATLLEHPAVADAGVSGVDDADLGTRVVAWVVIAAGASVDASDLTRHCRERLAGYKLPREFRFVESLPRNASGKLLRRVLQAR